jgi:hypothetical protein
VLAVLFGYHPPMTLPLEVSAGAQFWELDLGPSVVLIRPPNEADSAAARPTVIRIVQLCPRLVREIYPGHAVARTRYCFYSSRPLLVPSTEPL